MFRIVKPSFIIVKSIIPPKSRMSNTFFVPAKKTLKIFGFLLSYFGRLVYNKNINGSYCRTSFHIMEHSTVTTFLSRFIVCLLRFIMFSDILFCFHHSKINIILFFPTVNIYMYTKILLYLIINLFHFKEAFLWIVSMMSSH